MKLSDLLLKRLSSASDRHPEGRWFALARFAWVAITLLGLCLFLASIPPYFELLLRIAPSSGPVVIGQLGPKGLLELQALGISLATYALLIIAFNLLFQCICTVVGTIIFWCKSHDRVALFVAFALVMLPYTRTASLLRMFPTPWDWSGIILESVGNICILLCAYIFPSGRFVPSWTRWFAGGMVIYWVANYCIRGTLFPNIARLNFWFELFIFLSLMFCAMLAQVYRYRFVSTPQERKQTRWIVFGTIVMVLCEILSYVFYYLLFIPLYGNSALSNIFSYTLNSAMLLFLPLSILAAIFYDRLMDIDVIINRTLVYGTLSTLLILVYAASVIGLRSLLGSIANGSEFAIIISTLAIATLFQPLRTKVQDVIDRRFYRHKYDTAKTLEAFQVTMRNEVDLTQLSKQMVAIVDETMQPTHTSLWLRSFGPYDRSRRPDV